jgi:molybdate transport system substrate-binding protein
MKIKIRFLFLSILFSSLLITPLAGCPYQTGSPALTQNPTPLPLAGREITIFAGSASKPPLDEAARAFEKQSGARVYLTYGGSGSVLSQMKLSQMGDVFIPGSPDYLVKAEREGVIDPASTKIVAYLIPVIAVQSGNPKNIQSLSDLAGPGNKVGIGNPVAVCLGLYSIEILDFNHLLTDVFNNIITQADSCERTATLLSLKSVDAVIGWHVFHNWDPGNIDILYLEPDQVPRIAYIPAAISTYTKQKESARSFIDFLASVEGQNIFRRWGYLATEGEARQLSPGASIGGEYLLPETYKNLLK